MIILGWMLKGIIIYIVFKIINWRKERKRLEWNRIKKGEKMKIRLEEIAKEMKKAGYKSRDFDSDDFINRVAEILAERDLFAMIADEMTIIEEEILENREEF